MNEDIALWTTVRQAEAIRKGQTTSRALLEHVIERIDRLNPTLNAIVTLDLDAARAAADAADTALARGDVVGPLHGVPITIKDALETRGMRSTGGATELRDNVPDRDAPVVRAVREAGAIVLGKTNLPRWSGDLQSFNDLFGTTVNPWNPERVPGGSSGGAATAVAAGLSSFEIGTDIGGSIRIPSSYCGVFGHKPSFGIVPSRGYLDHEQGGTTEADINVIGPIARSAEDLELLLKILLRSDRPLVADLAPPPEDPRTLRVAAWLDDPFCPVDTEVLEVMNAAADALEKSGVAVDRSARPDIDVSEVSSLGLWLVFAAMAQSLPPEMSADTTHHAWLDAHMAREAVRAKWAEFFTRYDAILMPVTMVPPFEHSQSGDFASRTLPCNGIARPYLDLVSYTVLVGMAYLLVTVATIGTGKSNLPTGIQVVGPYGADFRTIRLAGYIAELCGGYQPPPMATD